MLPGSAHVIHGEALAQLRLLPDASVDAVITDPPYELGFMGKRWDGSGIAYSVELWAQCLRVLKPGGHLAAFGGSRTYHRMACAVEDAGFEIRDSLTWLYGSGFPKSLDVSKVIDKAAEAEREVIGVSPHSANRARVAGRGETVHREGGDLPDEPAREITAPATDAARTWQGWGTALKPAFEPLVIGVKPLLSSDILVEIGSHLDRLESACSSPVRPTTAAGSFAPTRPTVPAAKGGSAHESAATQLAGDPVKPTATGTAADSSATTDTSWSESAATTCLNIVSSWRECWAELSTLTSTCTTSTGSSTTIDLRTLLSCLSRITAESMRATSCAPSAGSSSDVAAADALFGAALFSSRATLALSATEAATAATPTSHQDATEPGSAAQEPIVLARKPLAGTVASNVLAHGVGGLNIDATRVGAEERTYRPRGTTSNNAMIRVPEAKLGSTGEPSTVTGRWPSNVLLSHGEECADECVPGCPVAELDAQSGNRPGAVSNGSKTGAGMCDSDTFKIHAREQRLGYGDVGGASRFFPTFRYQAKAPTRERPKVDGIAHPTVKPLALMAWLVRLLCPPGGLVLDPFAGSGTTLQAARGEGMRAIGIEREADYLPLIAERLARSFETNVAVDPDPALFDMPA